MLRLKVKKKTSRIFTMYPSALPVELEFSQFSFHFLLFFTVNFVLKPNISMF